ERLDERIETTSPTTDALPCGQETRKRCCIDGFDLVPQGGKRTSAQRAQHAGIAPLPFDTSRAELAEHHATVSLEPSERVAHTIDRHVEAAVHVLDGERHVCPRVPCHELIERTLDRLGECRREPL